MIAHGVATLVLLGFTSAFLASEADHSVGFGLGNDVVFEGYLTAETAADLVARLQAPSVDHLIITSGGGDENAAMDVADVVNQRGLRVTVRGRCVSACANTILIAGSARYLENRAVVAFHHSSPVIEKNYITLHRPAPERIVRGAERVRALYREKSANLAILDCAASKIGLTQQLVEARLPEEDIIRMAWLSRHQFWVPRDDTLARFGVPVVRVGATPNRRVAERVLERSVGVVMGDSHDCPQWP